METVLTRYDGEVSEPLWGAREVGSPCEWRGGARHCSRAMVGESGLENTEDAGSIPGREDPLEEGVATHFSILPRSIPWTEEPGALQSTGCRVRHD